MIVYVESNFILELAFAQDEASSCEDVLDLAETRAIMVSVTEGRADDLM